VLVLVLVLGGLGVWRQMGSASAKPTARQALWDLYDLWDVAGLTGLWVER
jgi:hypothetical protein